MKSLSQYISESIDDTHGIIEIRCNQSEVYDIVDELSTEFPKSKITIDDKKKSGSSVILFDHSTDYNSVMKLHKLLKDNFDTAKIFKYKNINT